VVGFTVSHRGLNFHSKTYEESYVNDMSYNIHNASSVTLTNNIDTTKAEWDVGLGVKIERYVKENVI
jgi:hypothetical protein